jgi:hypothetical protein
VPAVRHSEFKNEEVFVRSIPPLDVGKAARPALVDGTPGAAWAPGGPPRAIWAFKVEQGRIVEVQFIADPKKIARLDVLLLD